MHCSSVSRLPTLACETSASMALSNGRCSWSSCSLADAAGASAPSLGVSPVVTHGKGCNKLQTPENGATLSKKGTFAAGAEPSSTAQAKAKFGSNGLSTGSAATHDPALVAPRFPSCILGIGTANPETTFPMDGFGDDLIEGFGYAGIPEVKEFTTRICKSSGISEKRMAYSHTLYMNNHNLKTYGAPSLDMRSDLFEPEAMKIAKMAAERALIDWGGHKSDITHLITYSTTGMLSPAIDMRLIKALGLAQSVKHFWVSLMGCHAGLIGIRTAAEIAQANAKNRVLVVCVEINSLQAQPLNPAALKDMNNMVVSIIFGDGAAGVVIGAQPTEAEIPILEIDRCQTSYIPDTDTCITASFTQSGLQASLDKNVPSLVGQNSAKFVTQLLQGTALRFETVNWAVHPGGKAIVDAVEKGCRLAPEQLRCSRYILEHYANMSSPTIMFVLDKLRQEARVCMSPGSGQQVIHPWTVALGFGPGLTMEGILLKFC